MEIRLLSDHRKDLVAERTRVQNRLRWHLLELCPELEQSLRRGSLEKPRQRDGVDFEVHAGPPGLGVSPRRAAGRRTRRSSSGIRSGGAAASVGTRTGGLAAPAQLRALPGEPIELDRRPLTLERRAPAVLDHQVGALPDGLQRHRRDHAVTVDVAPDQRHRSHPPLNGGSARRSVDDAEHRTDRHLRTSAMHGSGCSQRQSSMPTSRRLPRLPWRISQWRRMVSTFASDIARSVSTPGLLGAALEPFPWFPRFLGSSFCACRRTTSGTSSLPSP